MIDAKTANSYVNETFTVERIIRKKVVAGKTYYKIKWLGYPNSDNTWESLSDLVDTFHCVPIIEEFENCDEDFEYIGDVEKIVKHTIMDGITHCFIRWRGHCNGYNTWELAENASGQDSKRIVVAEEYETQISGSEAINYCIEKIQDRTIINGKIYCFIKIKGSSESDYKWALLTVLLKNGLIRLKPL